MERSDGTGKDSEREKEKRNIALERWREREWRGRMAQGKLVREKRKKGI